MTTRLLARTAWILSPLLALSGCATFSRLLEPLRTSSPSPAKAGPVVPSFALSPREGALQDSLKDRLEWLAGQPLPDSWTLVSVAFRTQSDSSLALEILLRDARRLNSGRLSDSARRVLAAKPLIQDQPLAAPARLAGLAPVVLRSIVRSRDFLRQNSVWRQDTVSWHVPEAPVQGSK